MSQKGVPEIWETGLTHMGWWSRGACPRVWPLTASWEPILIRRIEVGSGRISHLVSFARQVFP